MRLTAAVARRTARWGDALAARSMQPGEPINVRQIPNLRVAVVCDQFTALGIAPECQATFLTPGDWRTQIQRSRPHLLLVESCWSGRSGLWRGLVTGAGETITRAVRFCRIAGIPTIFWAKEDPVHLDDFLATAKLFDWVFTTDADSLSRYQHELGHDRVGVMTFPVQPRLHNPLGAATRANASVFAGAWYANFPKRCAEFTELATGLMQAGPFHVYRRPGPPDIGDYPEEFAPSLRPAVDYAHIGDIYRNYLIGLSINTVTESPTMFARRAVEMLACGTAVYSNRCRALGELFPGLVDQFECREDIVVAARRDYATPESVGRRMKRAIGLRAVLEAHTWRSRLATLAACVSTRHESRMPDSVVLAKVNDAAELERLSAFVASQRGVRVQALAWAPQGVESRQGVHLLTEAKLDTPLGELFDDTTLAAFWSSKDWYGPHYLQDLCLAAESYAGDVVAKGGYYRWDGSALQGPRLEAEYTRSGPVPLRRAVARLRAWPGATARESMNRAAGGAYASGPHVSIDAFSYVEGGACVALPRFLAAERPVA